MNNLIIAALFIHFIITGGTFVITAIAWLILTRMQHTTPACTLTPYTRPFLRLQLATALTLMLLEFITILYLSVGITPVDILYVIAHVKVSLSVNRQMLIIGVGLQGILKEVCLIVGALDIRWRLYPPRRAENRGTGKADPLPTDAAVEATRNPHLLESTVQVNWVSARR